MISRATRLGNVGKVTKKYLKNGGIMTTIAVVTNRKFKDAHGNMQVSESWHNVNFYSTLAFVAYKGCKAGDVAYIEGSICHRRINTIDEPEKWVYYIQADILRVMPRGTKIYEAEVEFSPEE